MNIQKVKEIYMCLFIIKYYPSTFNDNMSYPFGYLFYFLADFAFEYL